MRFDSSPIWSQSIDTKSTSSNSSPLANSPPPSPSANAQIALRQSPIDHIPNLSLQNTTDFHVLDAFDSLAEHMLPLYHGLIPAEDESTSLISSHHYPHVMAGFFSNKKQWNIYYHLVNNLVSKFLPLKHSLLAWTALQLDQGKELSLTACHHYHIAIESLSSSLPIISASADLALTTSFFLCQFEIMAGDYDSLLLHLRAVWLIVSSIESQEAFGSSWSSNGYLANILGRKSIHVGRSRRAYRLSEKKWSALLYASHL